MQDASGVDAAAAVSLFAAMHRMPPINSGQGGRVLADAAGEC